MPGTTEGYNYDILISYRQKVLGQSPVHFSNLHSRIRKQKLCKSFQKISKGL
jgi:hypothetical protein